MIQLKSNQTTALVNGEKVKLEAPMTVKKGNAYVPLRFISQTLDSYVSYNKEKKRTIIRTPIGEKQYKAMMNGDLTEARQAVSQLSFVFEDGLEQLPYTGEGFTTVNTFPYGEALRVMVEYKGMLTYGEVDQDGLLIGKWQKDKLGKKLEAGTPPKPFGKSVYFSYTFISDYRIYGITDADGTNTELGRSELKDGERSIVPIEGETRTDVKKAVAPQ